MMERYATGGLVDNKELFIEREGQIELIGKINGKPRLNECNDELCVAIAEAVKKCITNGKCSAEVSAEWK